MTATGTTSMLGSVVTVALVFAVLSILFLLAGIVGLRRRQIAGVPANLLLSMLMLSLAALSGLIVVGTEGYRALTREDMAAVIETQPTSPRSFQATFRFPDGRQSTFQLAGDQLYIDAHILKWKALGALVGLKTAYELDRVAGRYEKLEDEQIKPRTVYSLATSKAVDLFDLRKKYRLLESLVDAEYGSATFIGAKRAAKLELRVSATGLLIRRIVSQPAGIGPGEEA